MKTISIDTFDKCQSLRVIRVEDGCDVSLSSTGVPTSTEVVFPQKTEIWGIPLQKLRTPKEVIFPGGTERIGSHWFWGSNIEGVTLPNNIRTIETEAFCNCKKLKNVTFKKMRTKKNYAASKAGALTHQSDESERRTICTRTFYGCCSLKGL